MYAVSCRNISEQGTEARSLSLPSQIIEKKGRGKERDIHRQGNRSQKRKGNP
jgi:hypothetical protein